jgi:hypothetical protein
MTAEKAKSRGVKKGRPRHDDEGHILLHFQTELAQGKTVSEIVKQGMQLMYWRRGRDGKFQPDVKTLRGPTLERRFNNIRRDIEGLMVSATGFSRDFEGVRAPQRPSIFPSLLFSIVAAQKKCVPPELFAFIADFFCTIGLFPTIKGNGHEY